MKHCVFGAILLASAVLMAGSSGSVSESIKAILLSQAAVDDGVDNLCEPTFAEKYNRLLSTGTTTNAILSTLAQLVTNDCANVHDVTNVDELVCREIAAVDLSRYDQNRRYTDALFYAVTNNSSGNAYVAVLSWVNALGVGHDAFETYLKIARSLPTNRVCELAVSLRFKLKTGIHSPCVTNRIVAFYLDSSVMRQCSPGYWDRAMQFFWPAYGSSSNRLQEINHALGTDLPVMERVYLDSSKAELLSLPPGTMQLLSTNQFYNVDD